MTTKLEDVQKTTITIPDGSPAGAYSIILSHNLKDQGGNDIQPDTIIAEITSIDGTGSDRRAGVLQTNKKSDGGPAALLTDAQIGITINNTNANASGLDWVYHIRVTSIYWHSIQGDDHTD